MAEENNKLKKKKRPSALKRNIQSNKKRIINKSYKSKIRTATRDFETSLTEKSDQNSLKEKLNHIFSLYDKGVKKNIVKQNKAARKKSSLSIKLSNLAS
jgi:small subunit ribosomal protein S20